MYQPENIHNTNEAALYKRDTKYMVKKKTTASPGQKIKARIKVAHACNMTNLDKLPTLVVCSSKKFQCLEK